MLHDQCMVQGPERDPIEQRKRRSAVLELCLSRAPAPQNARFMCLFHAALSTSRGRVLAQAWAKGKEMVINE